ncbi:MAG: two-component system, chemotaxis family, sensor kinase CheA, partial [Pseudomonadota bacterium]|nr:two-component system, chemotaxis family, sensor kinase CheA [Pseudomonadota bacterium]
MALDVKKFLGRFVGEARDHVARLETGLTALENGAADGEAINALFRSAHTIKGSSRMLKLASITDTAHQLEEVLGALREGRIVHTPELGSLLMRAVDAILVLVEQVESIGTELPPPDQALCEALSRAAVGASTPPPNPLPESTSDDTPSTPPLSPLPPVAGESTSKTPSPLVGEGRGGGSAADTVRVRLGKLDDLVKLMGEVVSNQVKLRQRALEARTLDRALQSLLAVCGACPEFAESALVLHRFAETLRDDVQEQERLTSRLSDQALIMRMLPLSQVFDPAARMARELARSLGKDVRCEVGGGEIELDRQMIDRLNDVLTHLLRNAVDHGLESTEKRRAAGKSPISRLSLTARQEGAGVVVEIGDDGQGLNREKILAKAMQKGLIDPGHSAALTDDQVAELIFQPGLSTSAIITDLSGRGVGMDVVKRTIVDELHGAISVASRQGGGTVFAFKLPLSLAMMRVLLFQSADQVLGLAAHHVVELVRVSAGDTLTVVGRPALVLRNEFVPLIPLTELLGRSAAENTGDDRLLVVVIGVNQAKLGLVIDRLLDERDMVIKPLPEHLRNVGLVGGIVVTGANELVSVLQAPALLDAARRARRETILHGATPDRTPSRSLQAYHILVVDDSLNTREIEKEVLEACGYRVTLAEDGLDGWRKAVAGRFDAVLTDVEMPGLDGFSLTARLRENEKYQST